MKGSRTYWLALAWTVGIVVLLISAFFALQKPVQVFADGQVIKTRIFFSGTVKEVLDKNGIIVGEYDKVEPALDDEVVKGTNIAITRAFKVLVKADGEEKIVFTTPVPIKEAITIAGVNLEEKDIIKTQAVEVTVPNQVIEIIRVTEEQIQVEETVPYKTNQTVDDSLEKGLTKTVTKGKNGLALNTVKVVYHNGEEVERKVIDSKIVQEPINKLVAVGNITSVSRGGHLLKFKEARLMQASAYTYTGNRTATGKEPAVGLVAVDPKVIPLGTRLYIEGYGYAQAADTGGSIKGDKVDLFMEDRQQCLNWGRRTVKVYILD